MKIRIRRYPTTNEGVSSFEEEVNGAYGSGYELLNVINLPNQFVAVYRLVKETPKYSDDPFGIQDFIP